MASVGMLSPPLSHSESDTAIPTMTSATHEYHRTFRPETRSTTGATINTSPRMRSWTKGMLTFLNVRESGTVNNRIAVPSPARNVHLFGNGILHPPSVSRFAERHQPEPQANTNSITELMTNTAGSVSNPVRGRPSSLSEIVANARTIKM